MEDLDLTVSSYSQWIYSRHGYFSTNLEGVRKDIETFGILKKHWRILDFGILY